MGDGSATRTDHIGNHASAEFQSATNDEGKEVQGKPEITNEVYI